MTHYLKVLCFILLSAYPKILQAQVVLILNSETQKPVEFADILYFDDTKVVGGTYSNAKGQTLLELSDEVV
ncbi:MAG: hypothetical protein JJT94_03715, partial [Bernardetiaceae bacterium]|nr:hypothetical protein [Bernardetiaceae bacterium]